MAYAFAVTVSQVGPSEYSVRIEETEVGSTSEATVDVLTAALGPGPPLVANVIRQKCVLKSGTATTINPILSEVPDPGANPGRVVVENDPANQPLLKVADTQGLASYYDATQSPLGAWGRLFHRSQPDQGTDNVVETTYLISTRW